MHVKYVMEPKFFCTFFSNTSVCGSPEYFSPITFLHSNVLQSRYSPGRTLLQNRCIGTLFEYIKSDKNHESTFIGLSGSRKDQKCFFLQC